MAPCGRGGKGRKGPPNQQSGWPDTRHRWGASLRLLRVLRVAVLRPGRKSEVGKKAPFAGKPLWRHGFTDCRGRIVGVQPSGEGRLSHGYQSPRRADRLADGSLVVQV